MAKSLRCCKAWPPAACRDVMDIGCRWHRNHAVVAGLLTERACAFACRNDQCHQRQLEPPRNTSEDNMCVPYATQRAQAVGVPRRTPRTWAQWTRPYRTYDIHAAQVRTWVARSVMAITRVYMMVFKWVHGTGLTICTSEYTRQSSDLGGHGGTMRWRKHDCHTYLTGARWIRCASERAYLLGV